MLIEYMHTIQSGILFRDVMAEERKLLAKQPLLHVEHTYLAVAGADFHSCSEELVISMNRSCSIVYIKY